MPWPVLREEIEILPGPRLRDGQPSWSLHDPVRNRYFSIEWPSFEILKRWSYQNAEQIADSVNHETTLHLSSDDVSGFAQFLADNQLAQPEAYTGSKQFSERLGMMQAGPLKWLVHHYLFFRVPLWNPDAWLNRWNKAAGIFFTPAFALVTLLALAFGVFQVARQWDVFIVSLVDTFTWKGLLTYGLAIIVVKWLHELGHAFTAKRLGCRIPAMGVAFLVMFPMAYTDTNDTWRLTSNRKRLQIASAGIVTELTIAAWATLFWALLPDGVMRSSAFVLATSSWVATLAINASPFMRFDGYFILSDLIDMPNLHQRSFALARWKLREWLFGIGEAAPEIFTARKTGLLIAFAWLTWLYRLVVFIGIAILVYEFFFKALGIILFVIELAWFIAMPIRQELKEWNRRIDRIRSTRRTRLTLMIVIALVLLLLLPWPTRVITTGVLKPAETWPVYAPGAAYLAQQDIPSDGAHYREGQEIFKLVPANLEMQLSIAMTQQETAYWRASTAGYDATTQGQMQSLREALATAQAEVARIRNDIDRFVIKAPFAGVLRDVGPDLTAGQWVAEKEQLAILVKPGASVAHTYLGEQAFNRVNEGDTAIFIADGREGGVVRMTVVRKDSDATRVLDEPMLSVQHGGDILTREKEGELIPEKSIYRLTLVPNEAMGLESSHVLRGEVTLHAAWESPLLPYVRHVYSVLIREFGF